VISSRPYYLLIHCQFGVLHFHNIMVSGCSECRISLCTSVSAYVSMTTCISHPLPRTVKLDFWSSILLACLPSITFLSFSMHDHLLYSGSIIHMEQDHLLCLIGLVIVIFCMHRVFFQHETTQWWNSLPRICFCHRFPLHSISMLMIVLFCA